MNLIQKLLLPKVAGPIGAVLLMLIVGLGITTYVQAQRIDAQSTKIAAIESEKYLWKSAAENYRSANLANEGIIEKQTASIKALKGKSDEERAAYAQRVLLANRRADSLRNDAAGLLRLEAGTTDELGRCRAARDLLEAELVDDGS